jgi:Tfp pilus assembly PilM family ATPase/Tfp pilus assembly protein PilN
MFGIRLPALPRKSAQELLCIEINGANLKIARARVGVKHNEITDLVSRDISGVPEADIPAAIEEVVKGLQVKNPRVVYSVSSNLVITKNIEVPSTDPKEIKDIINLQAGRHTPYSREEIIADYIEIGTYKHSYTRILLVIVARGIVKKYFDMAEKARMRLEKVCFVPESLSMVLPGMLRLDTTAEPVGIAHVDGYLTDFIVIFKNKPIFVRSIPIGAQNLIDSRDKYEARFAEEIKRSLEAYSSENIDVSPKMMIFTGAVEDIKNMATFLGTAINMQLKVMSYLDNDSISEKAANTAVLSRGVSFLNVVTPLLALKEMKIGLVPEEVKLRKSLEERGHQLITTGIMILTALLLFFIIIISNIFFKSAYLSSLGKRYGALEKEAQKLEKEYSRLQLVKGYLLSQGYPLEVLTELYRTIPIEVELNDIRFDREGKFSLKGTASAMPKVFGFAERLEKSDYFKDVKTKYTSKRKEGAIDVTDFEMTVTLRKGPE